MARAEPVKARPSPQPGRPRPITNQGVNFKCRQGVRFQLPLTGGHLRWPADLGEGLI